MAARGVPLTAAWLSVFIAALTFGAPRARGQATSWVGDPATPGDWFNALNWSNGVPTSTTTASICNGGTAQIGGGSPGAAVVQLGTAGDGTIVQTGGTATFSSTLTIGETLGSEGTYLLQNGTLSVGTLTRIRKGLFHQTGGTHSVNYVRLADLYGSEGTYELSDGQLNAGVSMSIGGAGPAHFIQTGGAVVVSPFYYQGITLGGTTSTSQGLYEMTGGTLSAYRMTVAAAAGARVAQSGGAVTLSEELWVGYATYDTQYGPGRYELGDAELTTGSTILGERGTAGTFIQTGGTHLTGVLTVNDKARYECSGGRLNVSGELMAKGEFDLANAAVGLEIGSGAFADFRAKGLLNSANASMSVGTNTLVAFPAGFDPARDLASYHNEGVTYVVGSPLVIPAGVDIAAYGTFDDPVQCAGSLVARGGKTLNLTGGLQATGATVNLLSSGVLTVNDLTSGMTGGSLTAYNIEVGTTGTGQFVQDGGTVIPAYRLILGSEASGSGTYILRGGGDMDLTYCHTMIGQYGQGRFVQEQGNVTTSSFSVGFFAGSAGVYELHDGQLTVNGEIRIGEGGSGTVIQTGGLFQRPKASVTLGYHAGSVGTYDMSGGQLECLWLNVGYEGRAEFIHSGGSVALRDNPPRYTGDLTIGSSGAWATYRLSGTGTLTATNIYVYGNGSFQQSGGTVNCGRTVFVDGSGTGGEYALSGGTLNVRGVLVGQNSTGRFTQTGGTARLNNLLSLGDATTEAGGTYTISGGSLTVMDFNIGKTGTGRLVISDPAAEIAVTRALTIGARGQLTAVPGSTIHMPGTPTLGNQSTDPGALAGLANLRLIFEAGPSFLSTFEVAGKDIGPDPAGWEGNFALGTLQLGGAAAGRVKLVNARDNQLAWSGPEALYVDELVLNAGAKVDFNGLNLYFRNGGAPKRLFVGDADLDGAVGFRDYQILELNFKTASPEWGKGDFDGDGDVDFDDYTALEANFGVVTSTGVPVPEPATLSLLWAGVAWALRRRKPRTA